MGRSEKGRVYPVFFQISVGRDTGLNDREINFTIIIPYYNVLEGLKRLLPGITTYDDIQVIVVDDRSDTDVAEFAQVREVYQARDVLFLENDGIKGAGTCRNLGMKYAIGRWVLFCDADDYFTKEFHGILLKFIDSKADVIYFSPTSVYMDTLKPADRHVIYEQKIKRYLENPSHVNELHLKYDIASPGSKMFSREYLEKNALQFEEIMYSNDSVFSAKSAFYASSFEVSDRTIYCITDREGSLTKTTNAEAVKIRFGAFIRWSSFLKRNLTAGDWRDLHMNAMPRLIDIYRQGGDLRTLLGLIWKCVRAGIPFIDLSQVSGKTFWKTFASLRQSNKSYRHK